MVDLPNALININGQFFRSNTAMISAFDRSYLYGDSLYEVIRTYAGGKPFGLKDHLERLTQSAILCHMNFSQSIQELESEVLKTLDRFYQERQNERKPKSEAYCRLVLSRGAGKIHFGLKTIQTPTLYTIYVQPLEEPSSEDFERGLNLHIAHRLRNDPRALPPAMKSGNYLNNVLAYLEAQSEGCDDAILKNSDGHLTEGTTFNIAYIRRGIIATSPLSIGILEGITRKIMFTAAEKISLPVREVRFSEERLWEADEVFVTSTIKEIFPVTKLNKTPIGHRSHRGRPGPLTRQLRSAFQNTQKQWASQ